MHKQTLCIRRYLVRKAVGACTLMYRYERQRSESGSVVHLRNPSQFGNIALTITGRKLRNAHYGYRSVQL